ncbi:MAG: hypothetical protein EA370_15785 [Wenzhouxiangella sp.]|nr:MAG: hypothetical protein EA370_15785 [Wenzhouxiangella sp.]
MPFWSVILDHVRSAHLALPGYMVLGWDVAVTPEGPLILEANGNFGTVGSQKPGARPLIDDEFLKVFATWAYPSAPKLNALANPAE